MSPIVLGLGLSKSPFIWYFFYIWGREIVRFISIWVGLFSGFKGADFVAEYEESERYWFEKFVLDFLA